MSILTGNSDNSWDQEVEVLSDEISTLKNIARRLTRPDKAPLIAKKAAIVQSKINVSAALERIMSWAKRDYNLEAREKTFVHWSAIYAQKQHKFNEERSRLWSRMLWVRLIQARISGESRSGAAMGADELVGLAVRFTNLSETEQQLEQALVGLRERQKDLIARYGRLGIADANRNASGSLQARLGVDFEDAMQSAPARALSGFVDQLSAPVHHDHGEDEWISKVRREFGVNTQSMLDHCRGMVLKMFSGPDGYRGAGEPGNGGWSVRHLKEAITKLESLERQGTEAELKAQRQALPISKPKMVQNRQIQARK